jgi:hypothetical protein
MLLEWIAPPECPTEHTVVSRVTTLVGEAVAAQPLSVHAKIEHGVERRFRLELHIGGPDERARVLESDDCGELAQATALIVSFDLQSHAKETQPASPPTGAPPTSPPSARPVTTKRQASPAPPARSRASFGLGADVFVDAGSLPDGAWGSAVMGFFSQGSFRGELAAALWPRSLALSESHAGAGASVYLRTLGVRACLGPISALRLDACLHAEGGSSRTTGFGISRPSTSNGRWLATFIGLTAKPFEWAHLVPRFTFEVGTPLHYAAVTIDGLGEVYSPSPLVFRFGVGLETKLF